MSKNNNHETHYLAHNVREGGGLKACVEYKLKYWIIDSIKIS